MVKKLKEKREGFSLPSFPRRLLDGLRLDHQTTLADQGIENPAFVCQDLPVNNLLPDFRHFDFRAERKDSDPTLLRPENDTGPIHDEKGTGERKEHGGFSLGYERIVEGGKGMSSCQNRPRLAVDLDALVPTGRTDNVPRVGVSGCHVDVRKESTV